MCPVEDDRSETRAKHLLYGGMQRHHKKYLRQRKDEQETEWKATVLGDFDPATLYAVSTLAHRAHDDAFNVVHVVSAPRRFNEAVDTLLHAVRRRPAPQDKQKLEAYRASLEAVGQNPVDDHSNELIKKAVSQEEVLVVEVVLQPWVDRKKGRFVWKDPAAADAQICVVPVHLIRTAVDMARSVEADQHGRKVKVTRGVMAELYTVCRAFHVCYGIFSSARQYYIKIGSREGCVCPYHLRWEYMVLGLRHYVDTLIKNKSLTEAKHGEDLHLCLSDPSDFRKMIVCERVEGHEYSKAQCVAGSCGSCSGLQRVVSFFGDVQELVFGRGDFDFNKLEARDMDKEEAVGVEELEKAQVSGICYKRLTKTLHWRKDGTQKENKEFLEREVTLLEFWRDFKSFFPALLMHHDLSKSQGREFAALKSHDPATLEPVLPQHHVRGVIDFLQRLSIKRGKSETQQEFFAQNGCTLLVVSLTMHIDDVCNLTDVEKQRMKAVLKVMRKPALLREEHYYVSHDPERGQAFVQHALDDISDYLRGDGRWAKTKSDCSERRKKAWVEDPYYNGCGAGDSLTFKAVHMWSDGCCADFKCATLLLWLTTISAATNALWMWNWFCSCHGKTDECDAGGGTFKRAIDGL